jgi:aspartyl-tRNA(Asn)/glutamyl-tRNA(Gln) amidotransferase subunit C
MKVDRELVLHMAKLAQLDLTEDEVEMFTTQLASIVNYVEQLNEVTETAEPFSFPSYLKQACRPDVVQPSLDMEQAMKNAPERWKNLFRVPRILP